jgi:alpha/beta superfamily hydrolase
MSNDEPLRYPDSFPSEQANVVLKGPAGDIEALTDVPEPEDDQGVVAVVCHSLSREGASMHGKVVHMIERSLREMGAHTVRFNFRGVGGSEGEPDNGFGETEDLIQIAAWAREVCPDSELWLGGFGFGSFVAIRAAQILDVQQLVTVSPPVDTHDFSNLPRPHCPWLVIQGDLDEVTNPDSVYKWAEAQDDPPQLIRMEDTDHLFHRRLMDLRGVIKNGIRRQQRSNDPEE